MAVGIPLLAGTATALWALMFGASLDTSPPMAAALVLAAVAAERVVVQLGPRSWYTASTPFVVLAALSGGPLLGVAAGVSTQLFRPEAVWRRRAAEGGIAAAQGLSAGVAAGALLGTGGASPVTATAGAMAAAFVVNGVGRFLVILDRHPALLSELWPRGLRVDALEAVMVVPVLSLLSSSDDNRLVLTSAVSLLAIVLIAQRSWATTAAELAAEQANARRDQLTGAANRRAFEEALIGEHARVVRGDVPAGLFFVDLDRFKSVNDRFGHGVGDDVLVEVVRRLVAGLRPSDVVARWGGEEMAVLAPGIRSRRSLEQFAERIRSLVSDLPIETSRTVLPVTVSVGGTLLDGSVPPSTALEHADDALYEAKGTRDAAVIVLPPRIPRIASGAMGDLPVTTPAR